MSDSTQTTTSDDDRQPKPDPAENNAYFPSPVLAVPVHGGPHGLRWAEH